MNLGKRSYFNRSLETGIQTGYNWGLTPEVTIQLPEWLAGDITHTCTSCVCRTTVAHIKSHVALGKPQSSNGGMKTTLWGLAWEWQLLACARHDKEGEKRTLVPTIKSENTWTVKPRRPLHGRPTLMSGKHAMHDLFSHNVSQVRSIKLEMVVRKNSRLKDHPTDRCTHFLRSLFRNVSLS